MQGMKVYGEEVIPLSKLVKEFCLKQSNMKETAVFQQLVYARWVWKDLFRRNIWGIKNVVLKVDCKKHTIQLPNDCERLVNISVKDHEGKLQPLTCDPSISTVQMECIKPACSCSNCNGEGTLCGVADTVSYTTEMVTIQGQEYPLQTWTRYENGAIQQQQSIPTLQASTGQIVYTEQISTICNVEVTDKGCIAATNSNMELFRSYCGCNNFPDEQCGIPYSWWYSTYRDLIPQTYNYYGYWNYNAADRSIVHIFRHENGRTHWNNNQGEQNGIYQVIVSYQTNGETSGEEILVPQYAQEAMDAGMIHQQFFFNNRATIAAKAYAKTQYEAAKIKINKHLNPIRMEVLAKLQTNLPRW